MCVVCRAAGETPVTCIFFFTCFDLLEEKKTDGRVPLGVREMYDLTILFLLFCSYYFKTFVFAVFT